MSVMSQVGALTNPAAVILPTSTPSEPISTTEGLKPTPPTEIPPPTVPSTKETPPTEPLQSYPVHPQTEPLDVSPLSAYQDPGSAEEELPEEKGDGEEKGEVEIRGAEEMQVPEFTPARMGEVDLNEAVEPGATGGGRC